ncbi:hypothetical protein GCM10009037_24330 [Halarchaeum grantii]|uniref:PAS domain S-box-containing protein n=1 Tax=Halarchaeum grantii TaxID=1193105 RepID=A0A830FC32_9EURY|nr:PAS domain-containing protein [Halarchaeum grantii]GGL39711.1 hypothetical protein GCM10009037_24330 [Halarchaeum grantii]
MTETFLTGDEESIDEQGLIADAREDVCILHIEDDQSFSELVATFLQRERDYFTVKTENDPQGGLSRLEEDDVDCVISDYDMPGMNGLDVLKRVREKHPDMPFILFTGKGSEEIASEAISKGVTEYLQKGGGTEQYEVLANRIEQAVARNRAEKQVTRGFQAIEAAHDGISLLDEDGQFIYVNEAYADITGYDREELLGKHWDLLYPENELDRVNKEMLPEARADEWKGRTIYTRKDGDPVKVNHRLAYTEDDTLICTIADIPEAEGIREELSLKERAMDEAPIGIVITDPSQEDNPIIYANDGFVALTGYSRDEVIGQNCRLLQGEETREEQKAEMREAIDDAEPVTVELRNYRNNGELFWNRVSIAPLLGENEELDYFVGFQQDVTERRAVQERNEEWIQTIQELGGVLAHDVQTPLDVIRGRLELARDTGDVEHLEDAEAALDRVEVLTEDLAEVMQTGELVNEKTSVDVSRLVRHIWRTLDVGDASLEVDTDIPEVYADEKALRRMCENLLGNSLEHGEEDVTVHVGRLDEEPGFYVEDDGPGIPQEDREDVFMPGFTTKEDGTGFGMVSVAQIVAAHGWQIRIRDGIDGGTRFEIFATTM